MRYVTDPTWERHDRTVLAGSPLRIFRLTSAGRRVCVDIESRREVSPSSLVDRLLDAGAIHPTPQPSESAFTIDDVTIVTPRLGGRLTGDDRITVDDGSTPPITGATLRLEVNAGPAAARNAGRALATTRLIAFVDADVDLDADDRAWLQPLLAHFADPRVALVAPRVVGDPTASLDLGPVAGRVRAGSRISYVPAATILVRADAFDEVGGFDPGLRFGEDVDFVWRLAQAGWRCRYEPRSIVRHRPRPTWVLRFAQQAGYGSSAAPLALRHPHSLAPWRANGWMVAAWTTLASGHPVAATVAVLVNGWSVTRHLTDVPSRSSIRLVMSSYVASGRQLAATIRRVWWPIVAVAAVVSRRARRVAVVSIIVDPRATPTDLAYGWGVWRGMWRHRTWRPIVPEISSWPPTRRR